MRGMFLGRPLVIFARFPNQDVGISAADDFFQPGRRASQTRAQVRVLLHRKREVKLPFEPNRRSIHGCRQIKMMSFYKMPKPADATQFVMAQVLGLLTHPPPVAFRSVT